MIRKRRKGEAEDSESTPVEQESVVTVDDVTETLSPRPSGPWDVSEIDVLDGRIDFGGLRIKGSDGMQVQAQVDERTGSVSVITLVLGDGSLQVQAFAAPRKSGVWADVRRQLMASITAQNGLVEEADGEFGVELRARVPGQSGLQPVRFVGVDGPRWFLRGLFIGSAATPGSHGALEQAFRDTVVVRGGEAMAPGDVIALRLPSVDQPATAADE